MKAVKIIAVLVVGLIAAWVAIVPYFVGVRAEAETKDELDKLAQGQVWGNTTDARLDSYERGWFFSSAIIVYSMPAGPRVIKLVVTEHINQLAIPFYRWLSTSYDVAVQNDNGVSMALKVDAHSVKSFSGETTLDVRAPNLKWQGPGLEIEGHDIVAQLSGKKGQAQRYNLSAGSLKWSTQLITTDNKRFTLEAQDIHLNGTQPDVQLALSQWGRQSHSELGSMRVLVENTEVLKSDKVIMDTELKDQGGVVDLVTRTHADKSWVGSSKGLAVDDARLDFAYRHLDKPGLLKMQVVLKKIQMLAAKAGGSLPPSSPAQQALLNELKQAGLQLARHRPELQIQRVGFKTSNGRVESNLDLRFNGDGLPPAAFEQPDLLKTVQDRLSGKAMLRISRNLLLHGMTAMAGQQATPDQPAEVQQQMLDAKIKAMAELGMVKEQGSDLVVEASFGRQGLAINGKPLPLHGPQAAGLPAQASAPASVTLNPAATAAVQAKSIPLPVAQTAQSAVPAAQLTVQVPKPVLKQPKKADVRRHFSDKNADARACLALSTDQAISACAERY
jgi:uncharacterized protein YdgA (DUF945 family)